MTKTFMILTFLAIYGACITVVASLLATGGVQ